jgi:Stress responsive A/B Barrel Domain
MWITAPANALPCGRGLVECGIELPMSREGAYMGATIPAGLPYQAWAAHRQEEHGDELEGRSARALSPGHVPSRLRLASHRQVRPDAAAVLIMEFASVDALRAYQRHPRHLALMAFNDPFVENVASVDFTC